MTHLDGRCALRFIPLTVMLAVLSACRSDRATDGGRSATGTSAAAAPADSLVLVLPGATVWHVLSREATSAAGEACLERTLEIRRDDGSPPVRVPLLYTRDVPSVADDSTLEARVFLNCAPGDRYRIHMRTGQPTPVR